MRFEDVKLDELYIDSRYGQMKLLWAAFIRDGVAATFLQLAQASGDDELRTAHMIHSLLPFSIFAGEEEFEHIEPATNEQIRYVLADINTEHLDQDLDYLINDRDLPLKVAQRIKRIVEEG